MSLIKTKKENPLKLNEKRPKPPAFDAAGRADRTGQIAYIFSLVFWLFNGIIWRNIKNKKIKNDSE
jgi:hypothetical protein